MQWGEGAGSTGDLSEMKDQAQSQFSLGFPWSLINHPLSSSPVCCAPEEVPALGNPTAPQAMCTQGAGGARLGEASSAQKDLTCTQQTVYKQDIAFSKSCLKTKLLVSLHCNLHLV